MVLGTHYIVVYLTHRKEKALGSRQAAWVCTHPGYAVCTHLWLTPSSLTSSLVCVFQTVWTTRLGAEACSSATCWLCELTTLLNLSELSFSSVNHTYDSVVLCGSFRDGIHIAPSTQPYKRERERAITQCVHR